MGEGSTLRISDTFMRFSPEPSSIDVTKSEPAGMGRKDKSMPGESSGFGMGTKIAVELKGSIDSVAGGKGVRSPLPEKPMVNGSHCWASVVKLNLRVAETICVPKRDNISEAWINISKREREKYKK